MNDEPDDQNIGREIGRRIVEARREFGMSQKELADLVHVSERSMQAYESGEVIPYRKLADLASVLNRPAAWILHGEKASDPVGELALLQEISGRLERIYNLLESKYGQAVPA